MKRSLIDFDVLKRMEKDSLSFAEGELIKAADILGETLGVGLLELHCFGDEKVLYEMKEKEKK